MKFVAEQFRLGSRIWDVKVVAQGTIVDATGEEAYALCDPVEALITLEDGHPPAFILQAFAHELLHAIDFTLGLEAHTDGHEHRTLDARAGLLAQWLQSQEGIADLN